MSKTHPLNIPEHDYQVQVDIPWMGPSMNTIWAGGHWSFRKSLAEDAHLAVKIAVKNIQPILGPVSIEFWPFVKGRRFDVSNYSVSCKAIEDGLVLSSIIDGDGFKTVQKVTIHKPELLKSGLSFMRVVINNADK